MIVRVELIEIGCASEVVVENVVLLEAVAEDDLLPFKVIERAGMLSLGVLWSE